MASVQAQAVTFRDNHAELVIRKLPSPTAKQVLIQSHYSLISPGTERAALTRKWNDPSFRSNPGYSLVGEILAAGENPSNLHPGQRVIALVGHASAALASIDPWVTLPIPESVSDETALFLPLASVALHALRRAKLEMGEQILIIGVGIIGQIAITLARMQGARKIIAMDLSDQRLELARRRGADELVHSSSVDPESAIMAITSGGGVPLILDASGSTQFIPQTFKMAAVGGRIVTVGIIDEQVTFQFYKEFMQRELSLIAASQPRCPTTPTIYQKWTQQANRQYLLELMAEGKLPVQDLITHRFPAAQSPQVYEWIKQADPAMLGCVLDWSNMET